MYNEYKKEEEMRGKRGFTLIEVLIVVIILGILATIAVPQFGAIVEKSRAAEVATNIAAIRTGYEVWRLENDGNFPAYANLAAINVGLDCQITASARWTYATTGGADTYTITATRVGGPNPGTTIIYTRGATPWSGTHPGVPSN